MKISLKITLSIFFAFLFGFFFLIESAFATTMGGKCYQNSECAVPSGFTSCACIGVSYEEECSRNCEWETQCAEYVFGTCVRTEKVWVCRKTCSKVLKPGTCKCTWTDSSVCTSWGAWGACSDEHYQRRSCNNLPIYQIRSCGGGECGQSGDGTYDYDADKSCAAEFGALPSYAVAAVCTTPT